MTGIYKSRGGFSLMFHEDSVDLYGCGDLVGESHKYVVGKKGGHLLIQIAANRNLLFSPSGWMASFPESAAASISGRVITGYQSCTCRRLRIRNPTGSLHIMLRFPFTPRKPSVAR